MNISITRLKSFYGTMPAPLLLQTMIRREFPGSIAVLTSLGHDAGLLLSLIAEVDPAMTILVIKSGKPELLDYAAMLESRLGLQDIRHIAPDAEQQERLLEKLGLLALITERREPERFTLDENGVFRVNPLAGLTLETLNSMMIKCNLPPYPPGLENAAAANDEQATDGADASLTAAPDWNL